MTSSLDFRPSQRHPKHTPMRILTAIILLSTLLVGCGDRSQSSGEGAHDALPELRNKECTVVYRRDALGYATPDKSGISAETIQSGQRKLATTGKLRRATRDWILLENGEGRLRGIPVSSILSIYEAN